MADAFAWSAVAPFTPINAANMNTVLDAGAVPVTVNGWWRGVDGAGLPQWWDYYTTGGGAVATTTTAGEWETCGRGLKLSGGTAEAYQDLYGLLEEGWRGEYVTVLVRALRVTSNWEVLLDFGAGGTSSVLQGDATGAFEDRAITVQVPASADRVLLVLRWTSASGHVVFDRVQVTVGQANVGWLTDGAAPPLLCEGVLDDDAGTWTWQPGPRVLMLARTMTGLNGLTNSSATEDFSAAGDYWPTGTARTDAGSAGDLVTAHVGTNSAEASNNHRLQTLPAGGVGLLNGKPTLAVHCPSGFTFGTGDLDLFALVFQAPYGPDPPTRRAYPAAI